jgi:TonB family protein
LSQSHAAKGKQQQNTGLKSLDLFYAVLLHVLILIVIAVIAFWQQQHKVEPLKRIEVMMISAKDLAKLEQQAHRKPVHKKHVIKHKKHIKPKLKITKKIIKKPKPKKKAPKAIIKPKPVKKAIAKKAAKVDANFDPFAPVTSKSDVKEVTKKAHTSHPELADLAGKQLSRSEKERYIALMQAAVQRHWKVAISASKFSDPLVEMKLLPSGNIASLRILESSGNQALDASLIRAIKAAAPFELPRQQFEFFRLNRIRFHPLK